MTIRVQKRTNFKIAPFLDLDLTLLKYFKTKAVVWGPLVAAVH